MKEDNSLYDRDSGNRDPHRYDDIIHLPHPTSSRHPRMPLCDRAAQFSPFAALTGHEAAIRETARLTDEEGTLSEDAEAELDGQLRLLKENLGRRQTVSITYFAPDSVKSGGAYLVCSGIVKKIDEYEHTVILEDKTAIPIAQIRKVNIMSKIQENLFP